MVAQGSNSSVYEQWVRVVGPVIQEILAGTFDRSQQWAGIWGKGQARLERMESGLFKLGFQGKHTVDGIRCNVWVLDEAVEALDTLLPGLVLTTQEIPHWLILEYDPRPKNVPHPLYLYWAGMADTKIAHLRTTYPSLANAQWEDLVQYQDGHRYIDAHMKVVRCGSADDYMVYISPDENGNPYNIIEAVEALILYFGDDRVSPTTVFEAPIAARVYSNHTVF